MNNLDATFTGQQIAAANKLGQCLLQCPLLPDQLQKIIEMPNGDLTNLLNALFQREVPSRSRQLVDPSTVNGFSGWFGEPLAVVDIPARPKPYTLETFFTECRGGNVFIEQNSLSTLWRFFGDSYCESVSLPTTITFRSLLHNNRAEWLASSLFVSVITLSNVGFLIANGRLPQLEKKTRNCFVCSVKNTAAVSCIISLQRGFYGGNEVDYLFCKLPYHKGDKDFLYPAGTSVMSST
ncbi:MAG: hypothetical protein RIQ54_581 [Candidatus Parcubacteria bacterium]|jgi:hypothetical protein